VNLAKDSDHEEVEDQQDESSLEQLDEMSSARLERRERRRLCNSALGLLQWRSLSRSRRLRLLFYVAELNSLLGDFTYFTDPVHDV